MSDFSLASQSSSAPLPKEIPTGHRRSAIVLIPACSNQVGVHAAHTVQRKYADAVFYGGQCTTLFIPAMGKELDIDVLLDTGISISPLPVWLDEWEQPERYSNPALLRNIARDGVRL